MNQLCEANGSPPVENNLESNPDHDTGARDRPPQEGDVIAFASFDYDEEDMTEENRNTCTVTEDSAEGDVFKPAEAIASAMSSSVQEISDQQPVPQDVRCFTASQLQQYIERLDDVRSPQKAEDRKESLKTKFQIACITNNKPPSVPSALYDSVIRSDAWYSAIFHRLFDFFVEAEQPQQKWRLDACTVEFWRWARANNDAESRERILAVLLHTTTRSLRVRAALGNLELGVPVLQSLPSILMEDDIQKLPIFCVYFLHGGVDPSCSSHQGVSYVGQAARTRQGHESRGHMGLSARLKEHVAGIQRAKDGLCSEGTNLYVYQRLSTSHISQTRCMIMSTFPQFPKSWGLAVHTAMFLSLAEAIDILYLDTLDVIKPPASLSVSYCMNLRPEGMPRLRLDGTNRCLPTNQGIRVSYFGTSNLRHERVEEIAAIVANPSAYQDWSNATGLAYDWEYIMQECRAQGIPSTLTSIQNILHHLTSIPGPIMCLKERKIKMRWSWVFELKQHLEQKCVISPPEDAEDQYYRIPCMEHEGMPWSELHRVIDLPTFLGKEAQNFSQEELVSLAIRGSIAWPKYQWLLKFEQNVFARMLHRDVWENICRESMQPLQFFSPRP